MTVTESPGVVVTWQENGETCEAPLRSEREVKAPKSVVLINADTTADDAYRLACAGSVLLWRGDYQNARQLLQALTRRLDKSTERAQQKSQKKNRAGDAAAAPVPGALFHQHRLQQSQRARLLNSIVLQFEPGHILAYRRAPDVAQACEQAFGPAPEAYLMSLRELLGAVGAYEWRKNGVAIAALDGRRIFPWYGVFSPVRGEYLELIQDACRERQRKQLPMARVLDVGVGTGVLSALLLQEGVSHVTGTDIDPRALACAAFNLEQLGCQGRYHLVQCDLFPLSAEPAFDLVVCNPPWVPARPTSRLEAAVYDADSGMLQGFLKSLAGHLHGKAEAWLIMSDLAEHLGLRPKGQLEQWISEAGLRVAGQFETRATHRKATAPDAQDLLGQARLKEVTKLYRLAAV